MISNPLCSRNCPSAFLYHGNGPNKAELGSLGINAIIKVVRPESRRLTTALWHCYAGEIFPRMRAANAFIPIRHECALTDAVT
jgi:hypothetical protein